MRSSRWVRGAAVFGAWTLIGLIALGPNLIGGQRVGLRALAADMESTWLWAAFTPAIWWLAARFRITWGTVVPSLAIHLGLGLVFNGVDVAVDRTVLPLFGFAYRETYLASYAGDLFLNVFSYLATVVCGHAIAYAALSHERRLRATELGAELARAELRALEMQLRPHFLFNALHSVGALVRAHEDQAALRTLAELGDLLRAMLRGDGRHEATVKEELELALRYLAIEELRFGDRLETRVAVAPEALAALVPRLVLQPLVENAVRHGVEAATGPARIELRAAVADGMVWLAVGDGGGDGVAPAGHGIGLANTRSRLAQLYGDRHRLELVPAAGGGVLARVGVPYHLRPVELPGAERRAPAERPRLEPAGAERRA